MLVRGLPEASMRLCCGPPIGGEGMNTSSLVLLGTVRTVPSSMKPSVLNDFRATPALKLGKGKVRKKETQIQKQR